MSDSVTTSIDVAVPPDVAFDVFTREIDAWYRVDLDTLPDITRTGAIRFEPQLGGRLLDVHDLATGEGRELGRITAWEPGHRLVFLDNEGTEVEVAFEPHGAGTRVRVTHRGLDRLAPDRARELRRSGWGALTPLYRDHIAPNARPLAVSLGVMAALCVTILGGLWAAAMLAGASLSAWNVAAAILAVAVVCAALVAVFGLEERAVGRWLPSRWQYRRITWGVLGLLWLGLLIEGLYGAMEHDESVLEAIWLPGLWLIILWCWAQRGPAEGRSYRTPAGSAARTFTQRRRNVWLFCLIFAVVAFGIVQVVVLHAVSPELTPFVGPVLIAALAALSVHEVVTRRRREQGLGFDPDLYLAVARRVSDGNLRPQLLVHRPSTQPEYSGWYAFASEEDESSSDLVAWSMKDLVDHSPEAARPLREGDGDWRWDQAQGAYARVERRSGDSQPA